MRKWVLGIWSVVVAFFALFGVELNLLTDINALPVIAGLLVIGVWIFTEAKQDLKELKEGINQTDKWSDPAFWTAAIVGVIAPLLGLFNVSISTELISTISVIAAAIVPVLIKLFRKRAAE